MITTPSSDVIYCLGFADLSQTGPLVLEAPGFFERAYKPGDFVKA